MKNFAPIVGFSLVLLISSTTFAGKWYRLPATGDIPSGRTTPAVGTVHGSVYLFSGVRDDFETFENTFYSDLYRFNPRTHKWTELHPEGNTPPARTFAASAGHRRRGEFLVFGGSEYDPTFQEYNVFSDLWAYSVCANQWKQVVADNEGPSARSGANMWVVGGKVYIFGGITQFFQLKNDLWEYDFHSNLWTELIPDGAAGSPPGRHVASAGTKARRGKLTIYGGESLNPLTFAFPILEDTWQLDLTTLQWTDVSPEASKDVSPHRNYGASAIIGQRMYVYGGDIPGGSSGCGAPFDQNVSDELWSFHLKKKRWQKHCQSGDTPPPLKRTSAAVVHGKMYVFSGWDFDCVEDVGEGQIFNTDVYAYCSYCWW